MKSFISMLFVIMGSTLYTNAQDNYTLSYIYYSNEKGDFADCMGLLKDSADVIIPDYTSHEGFNFKVVGISDMGFDEDEGPSYLRSITLPQTLESIGTCAFRDCSRLTFIEIPANVKSIGKQAFEDCTNLKTAIIHSSGKFITSNYYKPHPFSYCFSLNTIIYTNNQAPENWVATTRTYVVDKEVYSEPFKNLSSTPHIIEMITFNENTFNYTGSVPLVTWKNNVEGYTATMDLSKLKADAGTYIDTIPVTFTGEHPFVANIPYRYTIKPIKLTAKVNSCSRQYGDENPQFSISYSGFLSGDNESVITTKPSLTTTATRTSNIGDYPISISGGEAKNYEFVYESGVLTVSKAPLSAKVYETSKVYGEQNPTFTIEYFGLKNDESSPSWVTRPMFQTEATQSSGIGQYEVKAVDGIPVNYELGEITAGILNVTPAPLTIKANDAFRQYFEENPQLAYSYSGFVNNEDEGVLSKKPVVRTTADIGSAVGVYPIEVGGAEATNYEIGYQKGSLTINKRSVFVSTKNYTRAYGEENPAFELTYNGFVNNEDESICLVKPKAKTEATKDSDVGTYPITISNGVAENYEFEYSNGTLTIEKAYQTLTWEQDFSGVLQYAQIELNATATSGLDVTYTLIEGKDVANLYTLGNKTYLDILTPGSIVIMAQQEGTRNYYSSEKLYKTIEVQGKTVTLTMKDGEQGELRENVISGQSREITILPAKDYKIHSVTYNDMDVTDQLSSDGLFTTAPILEDATLYVVFESTSDAVPYVEDVNPTRISARRGEVVVTNLKAGEQIFVFDIEGREQASVTSNGYSTSIQLKTEQTYIVKAGNKTVKVRL